MFIWKQENSNYLRNMLKSQYWIHTSHTYCFYITREHLWTKLVKFFYFEKALPIQKKTVVFFFRIHYSILFSKLTLNLLLSAPNQNVMQTKKYVDDKKISVSFLLSFRWNNHSDSEKIDPKTSVLKIITYCQAHHVSSWFVHNWISFNS